MDILGVWTIVELAMIALATMNHAVLALIWIHPPAPTEVIRSNGLLLPISMVYCAALVGKNTILATLEAIKEPAKDDDEPKGGTS